MPGSSAQCFSCFDKRPQVSGNFRRRKPIEPVLVGRDLEFPFLDCVALDTMRDSINQVGNDSHLGNNGRTPEMGPGGMRKIALSSLSVLLVCSGADRRVCNCRYRSDPLGISRIRRGCWEMETCVE
jgi:hypothetical protein